MADERKELNLTEIRRRRLDAIADQPSDLGRIFSEPVDSIRQRESLGGFVFNELYRLAAQTTNHRPQPGMNDLSIETLEKALAEWRRGQEAAIVEKKPYPPLPFEANRPIVPDTVRLTTYKPQSNGPLNPVSSASSRDDPAARQRRDARPIERLSPLGPSMTQASIARYWLGLTGADVPQAPLPPIFAVPAANSVHLWIPDSVWGSPFLHHWAGRIGHLLTARFFIGRLPSSKCADGEQFLVRVSLNTNRAEGPIGQHIALPAAPEADEFIHRYTIQTPHEWATEHGYRHQHYEDDYLSQRFRQRPDREEFLTALKQEGWEVLDDGRTGDVWCRRKS